MLAVDDLVVSYGEITVLHGLTICVGERRIVSVLGANGAGKTTLLRTISGLTRPRSGSIALAGKGLARISPERIVDLGITHVPQGRRIFPGLTVLENLQVARTPATRRAGGFSELLDEVFDLFPVLADRAGQLGWSLSGGEQQMLAIGRALIARPRLLLLDEPSLGLAPLMVERLFETIEAIRERELLAILLVEQNVHHALRISDYVYVMELGRITAAGEPDSLAGSPEIEDAYFGS
jgi:branched-chain amino acid transport system ATP-binding protein